MDMSKKIKAVVIGHAIGDAIGVPVEFCKREDLENAPLTDMRGFGTHPVPTGAWSDDTSMSLAALDSLSKGSVDWDEIMRNFGDWLQHNKYTPTGEVFDSGGTCVRAIMNYCSRNIPAPQCGETTAYSNGNGSLMRLHPFVLYAYTKQLPFEQWIELIHTASALTHGHERAKLGCGIYACILWHLLDRPDKRVIQTALRQAEAHYRDHGELEHYQRLFQCDFDQTERSAIKSSGYVVDTLEAALWCLLTTDTYRDCVLKAANLGEDTDTVAAVAGSLAGALYGYDSLPKEWLDQLIQREYIEEMCQRASNAWMA